MGILDDLAMGFGLKERTQDYDARTARTIAVNEAVANAPNQQVATMQTSKIMANMPKDLVANSAPAQQFLKFAGGSDQPNYNPAIVKDQRPFMQRLLYSPESAPSPNPYAIGPISMKQPLPAFGVMGLLQALAGGGKKKEAAPMSTFDSSYNMGSLIPRPTPEPVADDGQITEEELADVTGEPTASNEFEGMNAMEIKDALMAKFNETGVDPTLEYDAAELFDNDNVFINYLKTKPMEDRAVAYANRLAGR